MIKKLSELVDGINVYLDILNNLDDYDSIFLNKDEKLFTDKIHEINNYIKKIQEFNKELSLNVIDIKDKFPYIINGFLIELEKMDLYLNKIKKVYIVNDFSMDNYFKELNIFLDEIIKQNNISFKSSDNNQEQILLKINSITTKFNSWSLELNKIIRKM